MAASVPPALAIIETHKVHLLVALQPENSLLLQLLSALFTLREEEARHDDRVLG
jgi:hypothetical protein